MSRYYKKQQQKKQKNKQTNKQTITFGKMELSVLLIIGIQRICQNIFF